MPVRDSDARPHYLWCLLGRLYKKLSEDSPYSVHVQNRARCFSDEELSKYSCAVNISLESESYTDARPKPKGERCCAYETDLSVKFEIYAKGCERESLYNAFICMADVQERLCDCDGIKVLLPLRNTFDTSYEAAEEITIFTLNYQIEYTHDPANPTKKKDCKTCQD